MEQLLEHFGDENRDQLTLWVQLVDQLRPPRASDTARAVTNLRELVGILARRPDLRTRLNDALARLFRERKQVSLYASAGLLPSTGFFSETARRIAGRLLPDVIDTAYMKDVLAVLFPRRDDELWVNAVPDELWRDVVLALLTDEEPAADSDVRRLPQGVTEVLEALRWKHCACCPITFAPSAWTPS